MNANTTVDQHRSAITDMDSYSQAMSRSIEAIAKLALKSLETPAGWRDPEGIGSAMGAIARMAQDAWDVIRQSADILVSSAPTLSAPMRSAVETIVLEAKTYFVDIAAVANLARAAVQGASGSQALDDVPGALSAIIYMASDVRDWIYAAASDAGAGYTDEDELSRWAARSVREVSVDHAC